eukprot:1145787-Pelagomonas_calceolata.AAC.3
MQIAALNMNAKLALYLKKAKKNAKKNGVTFPRHHPTNGKSRYKYQMTAGERCTAIGCRALGFQNRKLTPLVLTMSDGRGTASMAPLAVSIYYSSVYSSQ